MITPRFGSASSLDRLSNSESAIEMHQEAPHSNESTASAVALAREAAELLDAEMVNNENAARASCHHAAHIANGCVILLLAMTSVAAVMLAAASVIFPHHK